MRTWVCLVIVFLGSTQLAAGPILSLTSPQGDLSHLVLGQDITFRVELMGLETGSELDSLAATIEYDGSKLSVTDLSAGPIVPSPLSDPLDFVTSTGGGLTDAAFLTFSTSPVHHITQDGVFYSFVGKVVDTGTTSLSLKFVGASQFNSLDPISPLPLELQKGGALVVTSVPEPSGIGMILVGIVTFFGRYRRELSHS